MSNFSIFLIGVIVTLIWSAAISALLWAAYQDGKSETLRKKTNLKK